MELFLVDVSARFTGVISDDRSHSPEYMLETFLQKVECSKPK